MLKILSVIVLFGSTSLFTFCQNYLDIFKIDYALNTPATFDSTQNTTQLQEVNADLSIPIVVTEKTAILTGLVYDLTHASFIPNAAKIALHGITLKAGLNIKHTSKLSGTYLFLPKLASDLRRINRTDFQFGGAVLMKYQKSKFLNYKFGVYANRELFSTILVPMFGLYFLNKSKKLEIKLLLPLAGDLNYVIANKMRVGLNFKGQVRSYHLNDLSGNKTTYLTRSTNDAFTYWQYSLDGGLNLQVGLGRSIARSYRMYDERVSFALPLVYFNDSRTQLNQDFEDTWFFKIGLFYRLDLQ